MKKEDVLKIKTPLSQADFKMLQEAFDYEIVEREELTDDVLEEMDAMWAKENEQIYKDKLADGTFGEYD